MDKYLLNNVLTFRVPTVTDALALRDELSNLPLGDLVNFSYTTKYIKVKGEIVEEYQLVKAKLELLGIKVTIEEIEFNAEKDPMQHINVSYETEF